MAAVPKALDDDGTPDGYESLSGTSFSAPMVSAAMAWVRAARPDLQPDQVAPGRAAVGTRRRPQGLGLADRLRRARRRQRARDPDGQAADARPVRAQRQPLLGERPGVRHAVARRVVRHRQGAAGRAAGQGGGPGRRLPDRRPGPPAGARVAGAALRATSSSRSSAPRRGRSTTRPTAWPTRTAVARPHRARHGRQPRQARPHLLRRWSRRRAARSTRTGATRSRSPRSARPPAPTAPRPGRRSPRAPRGWAPAGCRAGTTRRPARPDSPSRPR